MESISKQRLSVSFHDLLKGRYFPYGGRKEEEATIKTLLADHSCDVNIKDSLGRTLLSSAAMNGYDRAVELLLANNQVDVNSKDSSGWTPLLWAAINGHKRVVELILTNNQVDVNSKDSLGRTPLSWAAENGDERVVRLLLANDQVDIHKKDSLGRTPLWWAAANRHETIVKLLPRRRPQDVPPGTPPYLTMIWPIIWFLMFMAKRLQMHLQTSLSLDRLSEFPNKLRPPCTTMPWNVRPALVVLWGVCWMFYSRSASPQLDDSYLAWENELLNVNLDIPHELSQFQYLNSFYQPLDLLQGIFEDCSQLTLEHESFPTSVPPTTSLASLSEGQSGFEGVETYNISAFQATESSEQISIQPPAHPVDNIQNDLDGYETSAVINEDLAYTIQQVDPNNLLQSCMAERNQQLTQSDLITTLATTKATDSQVLSTATISQPLTRIDQFTEPPRDSKGNIICDRVECGRIPFRTKSSWKTHIDRHNRPYKCEFAGCPRANGFGSKGELERHINSLHKQPNLFCPVTDCSYSSSRKDHLQEHMDRQHKDRIFKHAATLQRGVDSSAVNQDIPNSDLSGGVDPTNQLDVTVHGTRKRRRLLERTLSAGNADSTNEERSGLEEENKQLKRRIYALERELDASKKREETLFDIIRKYTKESS